MTSAEWEKAHNYTREHNCSYCKHSVSIETSLGVFKYICKEREEMGAGKAVKSSYSCDLWEIY
jgi:hypothetical protein